MLDLLLEFADLFKGMVVLLMTAILNSLLCLGVYVASKFTNSDEFDDHPDVYRKMPIRGKMILWFIRYYASYLPEFWRKPFYLCLPCMASVYSIPVWVVFSYFTGINLTESLLLWPLYAGSVVGINSIISYKVL